MVSISEGVKGVHDVMKVNKKLGNKFFMIVYNILGLIGINAYIYGQKAVLNTHNLKLTEKDFTLSIVIAITTLFFFSTFLLIIRHKGGILIPIFLLTFIITGGFLILAPLLTIHLAFYCNPQMLNYFSSSVL